MDVSRGIHNFNQPQSHQISKLPHTKSNIIGALLSIVIRHKEVQLEWMKEWAKANGFQLPQHFFSWIKITET